MTMTVDRPVATPSHQPAPRVPRALFESVSLELCALGYPKIWQAQQIDLSLHRMYPHPHSATVDADSYARLVALSRRIAGAQASDADGIAFSGRQQAKAHAFRAGYLEDPPLTQTVRSADHQDRRAEQQLRALDLSLRGMVAEKVAGELGLAPRTVHRYRVRSGVRFVPFTELHRIPGQPVVAPGYEERAAFVRATLDDFFADESASPVPFAKALGFFNVGGVTDRASASPA